MIWIKYLFPVAGFFGTAIGVGLGNYKVTISIFVPILIASLLFFALRDVKLKKEGVSIFTLFILMFIPGSIFFIVDTGRWDIPIIQFSMVSLLTISIWIYFKFLDFDFEKIQKTTLQNQIIFICGMPRSGSTLIEQMIAAHDKVSGAGELSYVRDAVGKNFLEDFKFNKQKIIEEASFERNIIAEQYIKLLNHHKFKTNIVTDKAPQNFLWLGFIKIFFPNSKIIHSYRNSKDNCLSVFKNYFPSKDMLWSFDQSNIANYYNLYLSLMNFWKTKFKDSIFDVNYEHIVESPEAELKKIFSFCNLTWDPNCLNFYQTKKTPISTVSVNQASKPIYKSSVNSNKGFSKYLTEMFHILDTKK